MLRTIFRGVLIGAALLVILLVALLVALQPPRPLRVPQQGVTLADVTVVNPGSGRRAHQTIHAAASIIESITDYSPITDTAPDARRYAGSYVLPGLIDMHVHHPLARLPTDIKLFDVLHLAYGVTTVRDCGSIDGSILDIRAQVAAGEFAGPRIFACGPLIDGDPPFWPGAKVAHNTSEGQRVVDEAAASGVNCIKAYSNLSSDALRGVRAAAIRHHLTLVGHVPIAVPFEEARLDDVQHLTGVPGMNKRSAESGLIGALLNGWDTIDDARIDSVVRTSIEQHISHTPTLVVIQQLFRLQNYSSLLEDPVARLLPRYYRELIWKPGGMVSWSVPAFESAVSEKMLQNFRRVVRRLHEAGVTLHVGTDTFNPFVVPGVSMHEELRNFVECGFTPEEAWEAATRRNAEALAEPGLGVLGPGAPADMLVFGEDPTHDLTALSTLQAVVANGRFYPKRLLDDTVARYRDYFGSWLYDRLTMLVFPWFAGSSQSGKAE